MPTKTKKKSLDRSLRELEKKAKAAGLLDTKAGVDGIVIGTANPAPEGSDIFGYSRRPRPMALFPADIMSRMLKIESDGTNEGTSVSVCGSKIAMVQSLTLAMDPETNMFKATISALVHDININSAKSKEV